VPWKRQLFAGDHKALEVDDVLLFVCASLPVLLAVVDSIEGLMNTAEATAAVERAAGLVTQSIYLYRCRAGDYSDVALNRASRNSGETSSDLSTLRQTLLQQDLATIAQVVDASGALLTTSESGQQQRPLFEIGTTALDAAGYTTAPSPPWYAKLMPWTASSAPTAADFALAPLRSLAHLPAAQKAETIDGDGYVTIVGRSKDLIISGGYNVYPAEVEGVVNELPGVAESAVVGVPHPDFGEAVVAVVVGKPGSRLDGAVIGSALKARIANFKVPKRVFVVDELPRNTMGKVQKNLLREQHRGLFTTA
jgi:hypothetical protein